MVTSEVLAETRQQKLEIILREWRLLVCSCDMDGSPMHTMASTVYRESGEELETKAQSRKT